MNSEVVTGRAATGYTVAVLDLDINKPIEVVYINHTEKHVVLGHKEEVCEDCWQVYCECGERDEL